MPKHSKAFIDKSKATTFRLVHRSQRDPLIVDERLGDHVLQPVSTTNTSTSHPHHKQIEEEHKYGIQFDDDYDYLQHLRDVNQVTELQIDQHAERFRVHVDGSTTTLSTGAPVLSSTLFETSGLQLQTGLLNQAAPITGPQPDLDPDIIAALDGEFDFDDPTGALDDDFILLANQPGPDDQSMTAYRDVENESDDDEDYDTSSDDDDDNMVGEEIRSRFTNYSMTSATIKRSEGLRYIDDRFDKVYETYDDDELGELEVESETIQGQLEPDSQRIQDILHEYQQQQLSNSDHLNQHLKEPRNKVIIDQLSDVDETELMDKVLVDEIRKERWDCETILTTYSNIYNHPTLIDVPTRKRIRIDKRSGLPDDAGIGLTKKALANLDSDNMQMEIDNASAISKVSTKRPKNEMPDDKRQRKQLVKLERRERRIEKKSNKLAFKEEQKVNKRQQMSKQAPTIVLT